MNIIADLHIHSRFSRATSKSLDFIALHAAALAKGITLVGTGDFTHPKWMEEIKAQLEPAEDGLFRLRPELVTVAERNVPAACAGADVRFVLQVEISNIYKKRDRTRKNHNLVFVPTIEAAEKVTEKLASIGNVSSDGRPILGLDARDLLEITLESDPLSFLVPAHIWTPWFSLLGSKSGFDSLEECFGDLSEHIFAAETGLSSDPSMNWRVSGLDRVTLISNSDAHSEAKIGREANLLEIELGYLPLYNALRDRTGFLGTIEFFPEEGKYHLDGHRKCDLRLLPEETREYGGRCPVCGGKLTVGVMSRVLELSDRPEGYRPQNAPPYRSLVPLDEVVAEAVGVGPKTKKTHGLLERLRGTLGPDLGVLTEAPLEDIERIGGAPLREAIDRVRQGRLSVLAGYDGEFGTVRIFEPGERDHLNGQLTCVPGRSEQTPPKLPKKAKETPQTKEQRKKESFPFKEPSGNPSNTPTGIMEGLNRGQQQAVEMERGPILVVAGPGTGKTRTLVARIVHQVARGLVRPEEVLAIAFTNQAALELQTRIEQEVAVSPDRAPLVATFHGFGLSLLKEFGGYQSFKILEDDERRALIQSLLSTDATKKELDRILDRISLAKQSIDPFAFIEADGDERLREVFTEYQRSLRDGDALDVDDLVYCAYELIDSNDAVCDAVASRFRLLLVDEYQDVNDVQAALIQKIARDGSSLMAIGDPLQAIYGFRGARPGHFDRFEQVFPGTRRVSLHTSYRLTETVLQVAQSVVERKADGDLSALRRGEPVEVIGCPTAKSEAEQIVIRIEKLIGGTSHFALETGRAESEGLGALGFGDVAVLTRTKAQRREILAALESSGLPVRRVGEDEPHDPRSEKIAVMTMHASKGREFEVVFVAGVEPGLLPLEMEGLRSDIDEERRLLYVAITRAKSLAVISYSMKRTLFGRSLPGGPSEFLRRLPRRATIVETASFAARKPGFKQLSLF